VVEKLVETSLKKVEDHFAVPKVLIQLWEIIDDPDTSLDELARVVETDPSLSIKILRVVNSAAFGFNRLITSVREAIFYMGFNEVKSLFIATVLKSHLVRRESEAGIILREPFWRHSVSTAILSRLLSKEGGVGEPDTAYVAGLIHDMGWIAIELALPEATRAIIQEAEEKHIWPDGWEMRYLGFTHEDAGAWLVQRWGLPNVLRQVMLFQRSHTPLEHRKLAALVHLAATLGTRFFPFFPNLPPPKEPPESHWKHANLSLRNRDVALQKFPIELAQVEELLRL
jgi:HD-like signal output (HDOD) protein